MFIWSAPRAKKANILFNVWAHVCLPLLDSQSQTETGASVFQRTPRSCDNCSGILRWYTLWHLRLTLYGLHAGRENSSEIQPRLVLLPPCLSLYLPASLSPFLFATQREHPKTDFTDLLINSGCGMLGISYNYNNYNNIIKRVSKIDSNLRPLKLKNYL